MTTQSAADSESVPRYFADFVQENARQHQELAALGGLSYAILRILVDALD